MAKMAGMNRPQFSLRRLLVAVSCLAGSLAFAKPLLSFSAADFTEYITVTALLIMLATGLLAFAIGLLCFTHWELALLIGLVLGIVSLILSGATLVILYVVRAMEV